MILLHGKEHDLGGGMKVRRLLPQIAKRSVGPFVFLDHMGPFTAEASANTDVRPHPHIGLSTLTYLFEGKIAHHDSLGSFQVIEPGAVNWMTAGKGISHSERTPEDLKKKPRSLHGLQFWVALPDAQEDCDPSFKHYDKQQIPFTDTDDAKITVVAGEAMGMKSPVSVTSPLVFMIIDAKNYFEWKCEFARYEMALYLLTGGARINDQEVVERDMVALEVGQSANVQLAKGTKLIVIGGEPFATPRHIYWNLVSSSKDKIEAAKTMWKNKKFPMVPGEKEFIPLPKY